MHLWDRLLPQAEITLNLLRTSRLHPELSSAAHFRGLVDYNKTAFAPPGCKITQESDTLGHPTGNIDIRWVPQCIITDVKMYTSLPQPVNVSCKISSSFLTIIKCHSYLPPTDCSWQPNK
jgi:hypothetical protein